MKKKYFQHFLLSLLVLTQATLASAQSLQLSNMPGVTYGPVDVSDYEVHMDVTNIGNSTINVIAKRESENLAPNHISYFCWDECYAPIVSVGNQVAIAPGETVNIFKSYMQPNNTAGVSSVLYSFYNVDNMQDSVQYTFVYNIGTMGVSELAKHVGKPYPNPVRDNVSVDLNFPAGIAPVVEIVNVIGRTVQSVQTVAQQEKVTFNTSDLAPGVYFIRTTADNQAIKVQKFTKL